MTGHLFIVNGDLNKIACDAILVPTDSAFKVETYWRVVPERVLTEKSRKGWGSAHVIDLCNDRNKRQIWLGIIGQPGGGWHYKTFEPMVREFVVEASKAIRALPPTGRLVRWPKPRLALNVVGSGRRLRVDLGNPTLCGFAAVVGFLAAHHLGRAVRPVRIARDRLAFSVAGDFH